MRDLKLKACQIRQGVLQLIHEAKTGHIGGGVLRRVDGDGVFR